MGKSLSWLFGEMVGVDLDHVMMITSIHHIHTPKSTTHPSRLIHHPSSTKKMPRQSHTPTPTSPLLPPPTPTLSAFRHPSPTIPSPPASQTLIHLARFAQLPSPTTILLPSPFPTVWYVDIPLIYTNALRRQTAALWLVLYAMHARLASLVDGDFKSFYIWFAPFHHFIIATLDVLQTVFLPALVNRAQLPLSRPSHFFDCRAKRLARTVRKTALHQNVFINYTPEKALAKLRTIYSKFTIEMIEYVTAIEDCSPMILQCHFSPSEGMQLSRAMAKRLTELPHFRSNVVLLLRWLTNRPETSAIWRREHLDRAPCLAFAFWQRPGPPEECVVYFRKMAKIGDDFHL